MSVELATAYVSIVPSARGMRGQIEQELGGPLAEQGERAGNGLADRFSGVAVRGMQVAGAAAIAGFGASLVSGFGRLQAIDDARFKLAGLGHDAGTVDAIMENALGSVRGTAFGLGDAATIAAGAVAAGIEPGEALERTLSLTGDAATIAGTSLGEMGSIFGKVAAGNRMMTEEMNQLSDRGIPVLQWLQEEYGVTADEAREMVSNGEVDFASFQKMMEDNIGGAALTAGESFRGSFANMGAAVGRFGAALLGPAFEAAPEMFGRITDKVDELTTKVEPLGEFIRENSRAFGAAAGVIGAVFLPVLAQVVVGWVTSAASAVRSAATQVAASWRTVAGWVAQGAAAVVSGAQSAYVWALYRVEAARAAAAHVAAGARIVAGWVAQGVAATASAARTAAAWVVGHVAGAATAVASFVVAVASTVAGWVTMGIQSMVGAAKMAAAWVLAMGPVGWVIAAVVALVALIVANWDTVVEWTKKAWEWVGNKVEAVWTWIKDTTTGAVDAVVGFFTDLRDRTVGMVTSLRDRAVETVTNLRDRVVEFFTNLKDRAVSIVTGWVETVVGWAVDLHDRVVGSVTALRDAVVGFFTNLKDRAVEIVTGWVSSVVGHVVSLHTQMVEWASAIMDGVIGFFVGMHEGAVEKVRELLERVTGIKDTVLEFFSSAGSWLLDAGRNIVQGLIDGIGDMIGNVGDAIGGVVDRVTEYLPWSPAKRGPLKSHPPELAGRNIVSLMADGMSSNVGLLASMADEAAAAAMPDVATVRVPRVAGGVTAPSRSGTSGLASVDRQLLARIAAAVEADREITMDGQAVGRQLSRAFA
jgi:tape measure domain-containing protein